MILGPVHHGQCGLPDAQTIEGFHQYSKCYQEEINAEGKPGPLFYGNRLEGYETTTPKRRKFEGKEKNTNIPLYFVWVDKTGKDII